MNLNMIYVPIFIASMVHLQSILHPRINLLGHLTILISNYSSLPFHPSASKRREKKGNKNNLHFLMQCYEKNKGLKESVQEIELAQCYLFLGKGPTNSQYE